MRFTFRRNYVNFFFFAQLISQFSTFFSFSFQLSLAVFKKFFFLLFFSVFFFLFWSICSQINSIAMHRNCRIFFLREFLFKKNKIKFVEKIPISNVLLCSINSVILLLLSLLVSETLTGYNTHALFHIQFLNKRLYLFSRPLSATLSRTVRAHIKYNNKNEERWNRERQSDTYNVNARLFECMCCIWQSVCTAHSACTLIVCVCFVCVYLSAVWLALYSLHFVFIYVQGVRHLPTISTSLWFVCDSIS